jgi:integrase
MAAKAYRLLRAVLMTAADDRVIPHNPCRIRGAGDEHAQERPVLTVSQVFELADRVGLRPIGSVRKVKDGAYRLRFQRHSATRTHPAIFLTRAASERAPWKMAMEGKADSTQDRRFGAMVLLATFASGWGEVSALRRMDVDLKGRTVRVRVAFVERSAGGLVLGPPKSKAGRRTVGILQSIVPILQEHMDTYVQSEPGSLMFPAAKGGPIRRSGFNTRTRWVDVVTEIGLPGLHFHDLRHTGNMLAAESGAGLKDLMARMGHDNVRAAMIYQHAVRGADEAITNAIDRQLEARDDDDDKGTAGALVPAG